MIDEDFLKEDVGKIYKSDVTYGQTCDLGRNFSCVIGREVGQRWAEIVVEVCMWEEYLLHWMISHKIKSPFIF